MTHLTDKLGKSILTPYAGAAFPTLASCEAETARKFFETSTV